MTVADLRGEVGGDGPVACHAADHRTAIGPVGAGPDGAGPDGAGPDRAGPDRAARSDATNAPASAGPAPSRMRRMTAAPTMTPSAAAAAPAPCSGVEIRKPMRTCRSVTCLTRW